MGAGIGAALLGGGAVDGKPLGGIAIGDTIAWTVATTPAVQQNLFGAVTPSTLADPDTVSVELATRLTVSAAAKAVGVRFYKAAGNTGTHKGYLYAGTGPSPIATVTFTNETATGWQSALFATPVDLVAGTTYTVSYLAPVGRYSSNGTYSWPRTVGPVTAIGAGYRYGTGGVYPTQSFGTANYYADLIFTSDVVVPPVDPPPVDPNTPILNLPRVPWEGGPQYWQQFPDAAARGWTDPNFFPIAIWWCVFETDAQVQWDKAHGINTYVVTNSSLPNSAALMDRNGMSWVGGQLPGMTRQHPAWVGDFFDDEVDGRYEPGPGQAYLQSLADKLPDHRKFRYTNYTSMVISWLSKADAEKYVNAYTDAVSLDMYWYTVGYCDREQIHGDVYLTNFTKTDCRTASNYGKSITSLRVRDAADGKRQSIWSFVENVPQNIEIANAPYSPGQLKGATMASIIHEARGIIWFNNGFGDVPTNTGNAIRTAQTNPSWAGAPLIAAMGEVNNQIKRLAPVLNTQSYEWSFATNTDTMLKVHNGAAYIFAMTKDGGTGSRTFTLPAGVTGSTVEVVDENRSLTVTGGKFADTFAAEYSYHVYKIAL
jgi:hypothetical protein